jgi:hypothetical protein
MRTSALFIISIFLLTGCTVTKKYYQTFRGESENWIGEMIQEGKVAYKKHEELADQYEVEYDIHDTLKITYKGKASNLGRVVEYSSPYGSGITKAGKGDVLNDKVFVSSRGQGGITHIPKDMEYTPFANKDQIIEVKVKWQGKEETIKLKYVK